MSQTNLFSDVVCDHCKQNPGVDPKNPGIWNGFYDHDTRQHVCRKCCRTHYIRKAQAMGTLETKKQGKKTLYRFRSMTYSEMPVIAKRER